MKRMVRFRGMTGIGAGLLALVALIAVFGPLISPHSPNAALGIPATGPASGLPFGTDVLGRDVLSRTLSGGRVILAIALVATVVAYSVGGALGLFAAFRRGRTDRTVMSVVDLFLAFPSLLLLLLTIAALGAGSVSVLVGAIFAQIPVIARYVRTISLEVGTTTYVEAAALRGERTTAVLRREIIPNISRPLLADIPLRFIISMFLVTSASFLGAGSAPPAADWGRMILENQQIFSLNPLAVLLPVIPIALATIGANLLGEGLARGLDRSHV
ncbi:ABC transporter permease [Aeromicrobium fastidiosum]|uniref:ABC transporter permease n=1 Tax=Aeromicrobium fastidiosum TaxID=52699 RepID=A0A641AR68_9ACTN|nr:ABC transporter permease [Aeromicrobium fastidiosum]KAA1380604.1 ABC transporter permease [Aeromicrobium fastidiosum]MBP2390204.1 peptide/nickel transport system permease protein [Aeromicrobium fastidiosum]